MANSSWPASGAGIGPGPSPFNGGIPIYATTSNFPTGLSVDIGQQAVAADSVPNIWEWNGTNWVLAASGPTLMVGNLTTTTPGVTVVGGTNAVVGSGTSLDIAPSDATHSGYLSAADWVTFNGKQDPLTLGNISASVGGLSISGGTGAIIGSGVTVSQHVADASHDGYLSQADFITFSAKSNAITIGSFGSAPNNNGLSISGTQLTVQPADGTHPGAVSTGSQSFAGQKVFLSAPVLNSLTPSTAVVLDGSAVATSMAYGSASVGNTLMSRDVSGNSEANEMDVSTLALQGATSGILSHKASATTVSYSLSWPAAQATLAGQVLSNDGSGVLSWEDVSVNSGDLTGDATANITITNGTDAILGSGTAISQHVADSTHGGYLSSSDWTTFNNKQSALSTGDISDVGTDGINITGGTGAVIGSGVTLAQHVADSTHNGYLSSTDWTSFNSKASVDVNGNIAANNFLPNQTNITSSGSTTTLLLSSSFIQNLLGSSGQTFKLPAISGSVPIGFGFRFQDNSTGSITVRNNGNSFVAACPPGGAIEVILRDNGSSNGLWDVKGLIPSNSSFGTSGLGVDGNISASTQVIANNYIGGFTSTVTAGQTVTMDNTYSVYQEATGSSTITFELPDTSTLILQGNEYRFYNLSSGDATIQSSAGNTIGVISQNQAMVVVNNTTSSNAASAWDYFIAGQSVGSSLTIGTFGSSPNSAGLSYSTGTLTLQPSDATHPGAIALGAQTMGTGTKTFDDIIDKGLSVSQAVVTDGSKQLVSMAYTPSPTASTLVSRNSSGNSGVNNYSVNVSQTSVAGGQTVLTAASSRVQYLYGIGMRQDFVLPDATTLQNGTGYQFTNISYNDSDIYLTGGMDIVTTALAGAVIELICVDNSSPEGTWDTKAYLPSGASFGTAGLVYRGSLQLYGATLGSITIQPASTTTDYTVTLPSAQGGASTVLTNDGSGNLSWATPVPTRGNLTDVGTDGITITGGTNAVLGSGTSISQHVADLTHNGYLSSTDWNTFNSKQNTLSIGAFGSTPTANAAVISGNSIVFQPADGSKPGSMTAGTQTIGGQKTFLSAPILDSLTASTAVVLNGSKVASSLAYTSAATVGTLMSRDTNGNVISNNFTTNFIAIDPSPSVAFNAGVAGYVQLITAGSTSNVLMPDATTLPVAWSVTLQNATTKAHNIKDFGGNLLLSLPAGATAVITVTDIGTVNGVWNTVTPGIGSVTSVSVASANGFAGSSSGGSTPTLTLSTTITGILKGNGTSISAQTTGNLTAAGTDGITITSGTGAVLGGGTSIAQQGADASHNGYLSATDWLAFSGKQDPFTGLNVNGVMYATSSSAMQSTSAGSQYQPLVAGVSGLPSFQALNLSQAASHTGTLGISSGGTGVISTPTSASASNFAAWDSHANIPANAFLQGYASVTSAAGSTTLTVSSAQYQTLTGSTFQTFVLPVVTTLGTGHTFNLYNNSLGSMNVHSSGGNSLGSVPPQDWMEVSYNGTVATDATSWDVRYSSGSGGTVTSVGITIDSTANFLSVSGSPVTSSGSITVSAGNQTANKFLAAPSGSTGAPSFRKLATADFTVPNYLSYKTTPTTAGYYFVVSGANAVDGDTYTNNGHTYSIIGTWISSNVIFASQSLAPQASGTLTRASGSGDATIVFSSAVALGKYTPTSSPRAPLYVQMKGVAGGGGGAGGGTSASGGNGSNGTPTYLVSDVFGTIFVSLQPGSGATGGSNGGGAGGTGGSIPGAFGGQIFAGQAGGGAMLAASVTLDCEGGIGGSSVMYPGGGASPGPNGVGINATANTGSGGSGGSTNGTSVAAEQSGAGGGAGECFNAFFTGVSIGDYYFAIGTGGSGGGAGANGTSGGNGSAGILEITEYFQ